MKRRNEITWFVVADGSRARFLAASPEKQEYRLLGQYESKEARLPSRELVSTPPTRVQESAYSGHHSVAPREDPHVALKGAFARDIATHLKEAGERSAYTSLVLYADPRSLAVLRRALDAATRRRVKAEISKDLTKVPLSQLRHHFVADGVAEKK